MEEAPENGKELSHSAHANGMNEYLGIILCCDKMKVVMFRENFFLW
jgi:hypothetical protein